MSHLRRESKRAKRRRPYIGRSTRRERRARLRALLVEYQAWWDSLPEDEQWARMRALLYDEPLDVKYMTPEEIDRELANAGVSDLDIDAMVRRVREMIDAKKGVEV